MQRDAAEAASLCTFFILICKRMPQDLVCGSECCSNKKIPQNRKSFCFTES